MASKTVKQFKVLFPASATPSKILYGKLSVELDFLNVWDDHTLDDLRYLVDLFGVPGKHLHLSNVKDGPITVIWLCSTLFIKELKAAIVEVTDLLQTKGVLKVFIEEELVLECSQPDQGTTSYVIIKAFRTIIDTRTEFNVHCLVAFTLEFSLDRCKLNTQ